MRIEARHHQARLLSPTHDIDVLLSKGKDKDQSGHQKALARMDADPLNSHPYEEKALYTYPGQEADYLIINGLLTKVTSFVRQDENIVYQDGEYRDWKYIDTIGTYVNVTRSADNGFETVTVSSRDEERNIEASMTCIFDPIHSDFSKYKVELRQLENSENDEVIYSTPEISVEKLAEEHAGIMSALLHNFSVLNEVPPVRKSESKSEIHLLNGVEKQDRDYEIIRLGFNTINESLFLLDSDGVCRFDEFKRLQYNDGLVSAIFYHFDDRVVTTLNLYNTNILISGRFEFDGSNASEIDEKPPLYVTSGGSGEKRLESLSAEEREQLINNLRHGVARLKRAVNLQNETNKREGTSS